jgi:hypothetical protein
MLSLKHNFLFVHVPKTGGNSIQKVLEPFSEDKLVALYSFQDGKERFSIQNSVYPYHKHSTLREYKKILPKELYAPLTKFTVVRNPWERMVSLYFSPHAGREKFDPKTFKSIILEAKTLEDFVDTSCRLRKLTGKNLLKNTEIHRFIRFENLKEEFDDLCLDLGIKTDTLDKLNVSKRENHQQYYDQQLLKLVENKFKNEIDLFEYQF